MSSGAFGADEPSAAASNTSRLPFATPETNPERSKLAKARAAERAAAASASAGTFGSNFSVANNANANGVKWSFPSPPRHRLHPSEPAFDGSASANRLNPSSANLNADAAFTTSSTGTPSHPAIAALALASASIS